MGKSCAPRWRVRSHALILASGMALALGGTPCLAQEQAQTFNIAPQALSQALLEYGRATDRQILFSSDLLRGKTSRGLQGRYEPGAALDRLLEGADLGWRRTATGAVTIGRAEDLRPQDVAAADPHSSRVIDEIIVVGSRLARPAEGPAPVTIVGEERIKQLGAASISDVLQYLPQQSFTAGEYVSPSSSRRAQLRGLGIGTTLVLINGRRTVPGGLTAATNGFDLNRVPLSAVERIEILAESASAIYGADAVGGVINIVLKRNIEGAVLDASYGAAEGGGDERRVSLGLGGRTERARGSITVDYYERDALLGEARDYISDGDYTRFGSTDRRVTRSNPGNICAVSGNLPGVGAPCAAVPAGSTGIGLTPTSFAATAGQRNLDTSARYTSYFSEQRRYSASASGSFDLTDQITAFGELLYSDSTVWGYATPPSVSAGLVAANNPFNPFGVAVRADFLLSGAGPAVNTSEERDHRLVLGLKGGVGRFDWEVSLLDYKSVASNQARGFGDTARIAAALAATTPDQALNVFQDGPGGSPALLLSLLRDPATNRLEATSKARQLAGFVRGDLFDLPAGALQMVVGTEWREESIDLSQPGAALQVSEDIARREATSAYAEVRAPLIGGASDGSAVLAATVAGRYDHYSDFGGTFNAQYGLEWRPFSTLLVRASYGDSYRAPGLYELHQSRRTLSSTFNDPRRGNESVVGALISGGNPDLEAETSTSYSFGAVWTPQVTGRPRFAASFWRIEQDLRVVTGFSNAMLLANEQYFPDRVVRAAPSAADQAAGRPGRIVSVDTSLLNLGRLEAAGLDLEATAAFETAHGRFSPSLRATYVAEHEAADFQTTPVRERVGVADTAGSVPAWRVVAGLDWSRGGYQVSTVFRYTSSYDDATSANVRNGRKVADRLLVDLQLALDVDEAFGWGGLAQDVTVRVGAVNLFDKAPPYSDIRNTGFDPSQGDMRQRFVYASATKAF